MISKCSSRAIDITQELVRNAASQALPRTSEPESASEEAPQVMCVLLKIQKH